MIKNSRRDGRFRGRKARIKSSRIDGVIRCATATLGSAFDKRTTRDVKRSEKSFPEAVHRLRWSAEPERVSHHKAALARAADELFWGFGNSFLLLKIHS